jgi:hypothetical protein
MEARMISLPPDVLDRLRGDGFFKLPRAMRDRLLEGEPYGPLVFARPDDVPDGLERGAVYVLNWQDELRTADHDDGEVAVAPKVPLRWITVTKSVRRTDGGVMVRFDVVDQRHPVRLPRRKPPATPQVSDLSTEDDEDGRDSAEKSGYTSDPVQAVDHLEAVDRETLDRFATDNRGGDELREARRRARWERLTLSERAIALDMARQRSQVDVSRELRLADKMLDRAMEKIEREDRAA